MTNHGRTRAGRAVTSAVTVTCWPRSVSTGAARKTIHIISQTATSSDHSSESFKTYR